MNAGKIFIVVFFTLFLVSARLWAQSGLEQKKILNKNEPVEIISDRMEAFHEKRMIIFSGNAVATKGDIKIKTDHLYIYYKKSPDQKGKAAKQDIEGAGNLEKIEAKGNVVITQKQISAAGGEAVYYEEGARIVLSGNPVLREGKNVIKGCRVVFYINENRGKVETCASENSGRVTAIITPRGAK
jgi:lipopolysaccharide export system protein LptA